MFEFLPFRRGILAAVLAFSVASPAIAGGKTLACYQQVHQPAVYKTVHQQVVVRPGGVMHETIPARYGKVTEKVLVEPERLIARHIPAVVKTVHQTVMVRPKSIGWEWRHVHGVKTLCKVVHPAQYATQARTVVVHPARTVHERVPARYAHRTRTVIVEPARTISRQVPPVIKTVARQVETRPATSGWIQVSGKSRCH
ncbi:MAG: hypothetical protein KUA43_07535 [Hoeflea sp.]|uniref:hypothetical protein n=1 Tax=Hoeflea sp. TaxID=1940281 RepID=UPI001DE0FF5C|nr:hypothetical protein [Hoeflea sp.]MBU4530235.1 hypothetical protein [Alphaproteobacteria bacterium]MBU4542459.1 hypothetical protein [Alphaproteobacteria bacterium]MBU4551145.1 hypothetical protein [Alphaproteobacteria bacterium]MBV1723281.1 hypothetical protein [Hoeflea sp.]MBV1760251.1 hypothetical protein [Hoeflea sp.]